MKTRRILIGLWIMALTLALAPSLSAQDEQTQPSTGVARVSLINGDVSTQRGDSGDWVSTTVNAPMVPGDRISTGDRSRAEVQLDYANVLRLDQRSEAKIADLTRSRIQVQLAQGNMDLSVFKGTQADVEVDTPNVAVQPNGEGVIRIQVNGDETRVIVREGEAQISTPQGNTNVKAGDLITIEGTDNPQYQVSNAPGRDAWDDWNRDRDNVIENAQSYSHTNRYYTGSQDLDRNGRWVHVPDYDYVWQPYVSAGWAPYRDGRWVWEPGWGWTWVSYEPWGWAPYHYGRWFYYGDSWSWWPGYVTPAYYPYWGPAYVSFIGFGYGRFGFGFGFGSIGWLPLGPYDYCHPWWGGGASFTQVNITNINNITTVNNVRGGPTISNFSGAFTNAHIRGAVTTVSTQDFVNGRVPRHVGTIDVARLKQGSVIQGTLPVVPTRQSLSPGTGHARIPAVAQTSSGQRTFFTRNQPPATGRTFDQHAAQIQQMVQTRNSPLTGRQALGSQTSANANAQAGRSFGSPGRAAAPTPAQAGESRSTRFGQTGSASPNQGAQTAQPQTGRAGWSRFGGSAAPTATPRAGSAQTAAPGPAQGRAPSSFGGGRTQPATQPAPAVSGRETTSPGWRRFGSPESRPAASPREAAPRSNQPATREAPKTFEQRSAPAKQNDAPSRSSNWQGFTRQEPSSSRAAPARETTRSGWSRFSDNQPAPRSERMNSPSRSESPAYRSEPRGSSRPPLEIRKPIVQERGPSSFYGGSSRGSWGSSPNRGSYSTPSGGTYSAPSRGSYSSPSGRSYSAPSRGSWGGGGGSPSGSSGSWGGSRGGGGGGGRSAPAPSSHGSSGGGRRH